MSIGDNIKSLRTQNNWTQKELSERSGIAQAMISEYEKNLKTPKLDKLKILARVFNVSVVVIDESLANIKVKGLNQCVCHDMDQITRMIAKQLMQLDEEKKGEIFTYIQNNYIAHLTVTEENTDEE